MESTLFSDIQRPYNTVTSPDQQSADATGNDQGPSDQMPMTKILAAVMRGAAKVQGQEQAKKVAASQQASNAKMTVTMKPGAAGEAPLVTVKDAPADLLNGTQQADLKQAYDSPTSQVESKLSAAGIGAQPAAESTDNPSQSAPSAPTIRPAQDHPLEQAASAVDAAKGYRLPRPWDSDIKEKLKSEEGLRAIAEEMGDPNPKADAHRAWRQFQKGIATPDDVAQRVADFRAHRIEKESQLLEATMGPAQAEQDRQDRLAFAKEEERRRLKTQTDAELKAGNDEKLSWLKGFDTAHLSPDQLEATARSATQAEWTASDINRLKLKHQGDIRNAFDKFTDGAHKEDVFSLGTYDSWEEAKRSLEYESEITPEMDRVGAVRWKAAHRYAINKAKDETAKQQAAAASLELKMYKIKHEGDVKPQSVDETFVKAVPADQLIGIIDNVKNPGIVLQRKEALLRNEIQDRTDKQKKANVEAKSILQQDEKKRKWGWETPLAVLQFEAKTHGQRIAVAQAELAKIQAARAARKGDATPVKDAPARILTKAEALKKLSGQ